MEAVISFLAVAFPLVFTNNLIMSLVKRLAVVKESKLWLRGALLVISALGIVATSALAGNPVDLDSLSSIGTALLEILVLAVGSHFSYLAIKKA